VKIEKLSKFVWNSILLLSSLVFWLVSKDLMGEVEVELFHCCKGLPTMKKKVVYVSVRGGLMPT
jgi:hypothetical protein